MEGKILCEKLNDLLKLEYDAVHAYITAIKHIDDDEISDKLIEFMSDHNRHVLQLSERVRAEGGEPQARPDLKGPFLKGLTGIMSRLGDKNALRVMNQNEALTNRAYDAAVDEDFPQDVCDMLFAFRGDEHRHKAWIEQALEGERAEAAGEARGASEQPGANP